MGNIRLTKLFNFEMAHALEQYDGLCHNIHGHSYKLRVTVTGVPEDNQHSPKNGMLIDFSELKRIVKEAIIEKYDHALVLNKTTEASLLTMLQNQYTKIVIAEYQPTSEQLLLDFANTLRCILPPQVHLHSLRLSETETSFAEWFAEDNV
jgi:6-pyruvoyltetrahydropterin/6-carboxytetrahydropterin synthase